MTHRLHPGDPAPEFTLPDADGNPVASADLRGRPVVLAFYPAAGTPGCTAEACDLRDNLGALSGAGYRVVGVSPDPPDVLAGFRADHALPFPLLADTDREVHRAYGAWGVRAAGGSPEPGVLRSTVVVAEDGTVRHALYDVPARGHVAELQRLLGADDAPGAPGSGSGTM